MNVFRLPILLSASVVLLVISRALGVLART